MTEPETDRELVEQVLAGKQEAFNLLVWRWERQLYNFLLRFTGNPDLAKDLCQETFLRSYLRLKELREKERFASWLFRIAVNLYRSDRRRPGLALEDSAILGSLPIPAEGFRAGSQETQLAVRSLILRLDREHREVVLLKVFHGFHFDEMAAILNIPESTVKSRFYKAFEELRTNLERLPGPKQ